MRLQGTPPTGGVWDDFSAETAFKSVEFASSDFSVTGEDVLTLTDGVTVDPGVTNVTISTDVALCGPVAIDVPDVDADTHALLTISGDISGGNSLTKTRPHVRSHG